MDHHDNCPRGRYDREREVARERISRSSLGTPEALAARLRTPPWVKAELRERLGLPGPDLPCTCDHLSRR